MEDSYVNHNTPWAACGMGTSYRGAPKSAVKSSDQIVILTACGEYAGPGVFPLPACFGNLPYSIRQTMGIVSNS